ncbi:hypothetical protein [Streptomyces sp. NPDC058045]|uniref:hypothetical protein n=1 Tax=Streptomyces sp. NPDC058045 TaxID=3346311 RepID=UPI0036E2266F
MDVAELVLEYVKALAWPLVAVGLGLLFRNQLASVIDRVSRVETPAGSVEFAAEARATRRVAEELTEAAEERRRAAALQDPPATIPPPQSQTPSWPSPSPARTEYEGVRLADAERVAVEGPTGAVGQGGGSDGGARGLPVGWSVGPFAVVYGKLQEAAWLAGDDPREAVRVAAIGLVGGLDQIRWTSPRSLLPTPIPVSPLELVESLADLGVPPEIIALLRELMRLRHKFLRDRGAVTVPAARDFVASCTHALKLLEPWA